MKAILIPATVLLMLSLSAAQPSPTPKPQEEAPAPQPFREIVAADTTATDSADTARSAAVHEPKGAGKTELSTELPGLDTLGILPDAIETQHEGGTRRINLEKSVFHREIPVVYDSDGRRDPFRALIVDEKKEGEVQTDLLRLDGAVLTGVVWSDGQYLCMVRDQDGKTFFLREGDPIYQGRVLMMSTSQVTFEVSDFGEYQRITLKVQG
jgi:hypothetical protein